MRKARRGRTIRGMDPAVIEASYPVTFRQADAERLGTHLGQRNSVDLVGMKRVGISNFLRFFLNHPDVVQAYIGGSDKHLFIPIDLNDLVERELFPFWALTLKRIVDATEASSLPDEVKRRIDSLFVVSIQSQDLFFVVDSVRHALVKIVQYGYMPTLFFLRFDRITNVVNTAFFDNLKGLHDATHQKLAYVFTSFRTLHELSPAIFTKASLGAFVHPLYISPATDQDMRVIYQAYVNRTRLRLRRSAEDELFKLVGGNNQYLQLALILLDEKKINREDDAQMMQVVKEDERIMLQSEELWESLTKQEQDVLLKVLSQKRITDIEKRDAAYLWDSGFIATKEGVDTLFSPLFIHFMRGRQKRVGQEKEQVHFSKKENLLFLHLQAHIHMICEREAIVEAVWPEYTEVGISDWAIDRLVARVRAKLRRQGSPLEIRTIRTRGYQLLSS